MSSVVEIKHYKKEFEKFMKIDNMPDFKIKVYYSTGCNLSVSFSEDIPTLNIPHEYMKKLKSNAKPGLFHEFTHILDNRILLSDIIADDKEQLLKWYTEYHATEIQMKAALRFDFFDSEYEFKKSTLVYDWFKQKTVEEDILRNANEYKITVQSCKENGKIYDVILHSIYYISKINFWNKYCKDDISNIIDKEIIINILGKDNFNNLNYLLQNPSLNKIRYFQTIKTLTDRIATELVYKSNY